METSAQDLATTHVCKLPECGNTLDSDDPTRGIWANICKPCRRGETFPGQHYREQRGFSRKADEPNESPARPRPAAVPAGTLEAKVRALVPAAKTLERRAATKKQAVHELAQAVSEFSGALVAVRDAAHALIGEQV